MRLERRYCDANIFIYILQKHPQFGPACRAVVEAAEQTRYKLITSTLTLVEVIKDKSGKQIIPESVQETITDFFEQDYILLTQPTRAIMQDARKMCWKYGHLNLGGNDAVHLVSALNAGCTTLYTYDNALLQTTEPGIVVERPNVQAQTSLPLSSGP